MYGRKTRAKISSTEVEDIHFYIDKVNLVVLNTCTRNNCMFQNTALSLFTENLAPVLRAVQITNGCELKTG